MNAALTAISSSIYYFLYTCSVGAMHYVSAVKMHACVLECAVYSMCVSESKGKINEERKMKVRRWGNKRSAGRWVALCFISNCFFFSLLRDNLALTMSTAECSQCDDQHSSLRGIHFI